VIVIRAQGETAPRQTAFVCLFCCERNLQTQLSCIKWPPTMAPDHGFQS
jgi:hypothetical protein